jgi:hypothetical protein
MTRRRSGLPAVALALAVLAGCGGGGESPGAAPPAPDLAGCESAMREQMEAMGLHGERPDSCDGVSDTEFSAITERLSAEMYPPVPTDAPGAGRNAPEDLPVVPLNTPHQHEGATTTVTGVDCGLTKIPDAASNPEWDGSEDLPEYIPAVAEPGMEFCRVEGTFEVSGKMPKTGWDDFGNLVMDDGTQFAEDELAREATSSVNRNLSGCAPYLCSTLNPGKRINIVKVYQVPQGSRPVAVQFPIETLVDGPVVSFALTGGR